MKAISKAVNSTPPASRCLYRNGAKYITIFDEPVHDIPAATAPDWLGELHQLLEESGDEKLHMEDFPRMDFGREPLVFSDEG